MQSVSSRIWTRVTVFISYDDNNYTTGTSTLNKKIDEKQYGNHFFFQLLYADMQIILKVCWRLLRNLHAFKINSSDILFHSLSIAVLSKPMFEWEVAFVLFSKMPHIA